MASRLGELQGVGTDATTAATKEVVAEATAIEPSATATYAQVEAARGEMQAWTKYAEALVLAQATTGRTAWYPRATAVLDKFPLIAKQSRAAIAVLKVLKTALDKHSNTNSALAEVAKTLLRRTVADFERTARPFHDAHKVSRLFSACDDATAFYTLEARILGAARVQLIAWGVEEARIDQMIALGAASVQTVFLSRKSCLIICSRSWHAWRKVRPRSK